jgi:outer membrane protein TolC
MRVIIAAALFILPFVINAQAQEVMTWVDCVKEAKRQNPDLVSAYEQVRVNKAAKEVTRSAVLPQVSGAFSESTQGAYTPNNSSSLSSGSVAGANGQSNVQATTYAYSLTGQQLLFDGFQTSYNLSGAERTIIASKYNYDVTSSTVRLNLKTAFADLLNAQELIKVSEGILKRRQQSYDLVKLRYESGLEHKGSLMKSKADVAQASYNLEQARRNLYSSQIMLIKILGRSKFSSYDIIANGDFEIKDPQAMRPNFEKLAEDTPLLQQLIEKKEAAKYGYKSANAAFFPQVYANATAGKSDTVWPPKASSWAVGTSIAIPIFDGAQKFANVAKTLASWKQAQANERSGRDGVIFTMASAWAALQDAVANVAVQKEYLDAAHERAKIAATEYSIGLVSYDNWTIIEDNYVSAKQSYLSAETSALIAEATWIQAKGGTLDYDQTK